jgi:hypothetical protein
LAYDEQDRDVFSPSLAEVLLLVALLGMPVRGEFDDAATAYTQAHC